MLGSCSFKLIQALNKFCVILDLSIATVVRLYDVKVIGNTSINTFICSVESNRSLRGKITLVVDRAGATAELFIVIDVVHASYSVSVEVLSRAGWTACIFRISNIVEVITAFHAMPEIMCICIFVSESEKGIVIYIVLRLWVGS